MVDLTKVIGSVAASVAALGGSYTLADKFGFFDRAILEWAPQHFNIPTAKIGEPINVTVARIKRRDDCSVEAFTPTVRDAAGMVHEAVPSNNKFTGPAGDAVDTFMYQLKLSDKEPVTPGKATLTAIIKYKCPEGERVVTYPRHENLSFLLEK